MRIITSGSKYLDIDAYAGIIAYAELLQVQGHEAQAVSTAPLNESVSKTVRSWTAPLVTTYSSSDSDVFTLIDVSESEYFDTIVDIERVEGVIDHHPGFERYWQERIGDKATIEFIGAACTLVYECWQRAGLLDKMSVLSARLLVCGILDNTLNFGAEVTAQRDRDAYAALLVRAELPEDWPAQYFTECQEAILQDMATAIRNDKKILDFRTYSQQVCVGQLIVWDGKQVLGEHSGLIHDVLSQIKPNWFMNLISINEGRSYFFTDNSEMQQWLSDLLDIKFTDSVATADRLWLRKEIIKQDLSKA